MSAFDLFSIGHSNSTAERVVALLRDAGTTAIADVRSTPFSRRFPWFSGKNLATTLAQNGMAYLSYGEALGGRPRSAALYRDGVADYEAMVQQPEFQAGLDRLCADAARLRVCKCESKRGLAVPLTLRLCLSPVIKPKLHGNVVA